MRGAGHRLSGRWPRDPEAGFPVLVVAVLARAAGRARLIHQWEAITGRPAPAPTERGSRGQTRLAPAFSEWLMGIPAGSVTGLHLPYGAQLRILGNGVVPQQATEALRVLIRLAVEQ